MKRSEELRIVLQDIEDIFVCHVVIFMMKNFEILTDDSSQVRNMKIYQMIGCVQCVELQRKIL